MKVATMFIKTTFKDLKKVKKNKKLRIKMQSVPLFPDITKIADFRWKDADFSKTKGVCHVIYAFFDLL